MRALLYSRRYALAGDTEIGATSFQVVSDNANRINLKGFCISIHTPGANVAIIHNKQLVLVRRLPTLTAPLYTVQLKGAKDYHLSIFAKLKDDDPDFPAVSSENDYPFLLSKAIAEGIMQDPDQLLKKPETDEKKSKQ